MGLIENQTLVAKLAPPLDGFLTGQLVDEFVSLERRYVLRDWEPAELDGGQFSEILGRILYHADSGNLDQARDFGDCSRYIGNDQVVHRLVRDDAKMLFAVLAVVHKFRSKRGAVHISPTYKANHMDSRFMIEAVRWAMTETVRLFWAGDREAAALAIRELLQFDVPVIGRFEDAILVQRTDLRPEEEILILLHYAGEAGFDRTQLGRYAQCSASSVTRSIDALASPAKREIIQSKDGRYRLTDLGEKRVREQLASKLLLG
ncbi:MAG TPA: hypothetical protein VJ783_30345 [Pirellulales bacterium]|nr:hypothetical protein [Pirellulales bacterium]